MGDTRAEGVAKRGGQGCERRGDQRVFQVGRCAVLIREPINATILRQSIIIFPICIATELLFKSAPPVSTPSATPSQILLRRCDSSLGIVSVTCFAFFSPSLSLFLSLLFNRAERVRSSFPGMAFPLESVWGFSQKKKKKKKRKKERTTRYRTD